MVYVMVIHLIHNEFHVDTNYEYVEMMEVYIIMLNVIKLLLKYNHVPHVDLLNLDVYLIYIYIDNCLNFQETLGYG